MGVLPLRTPPSASDQWWTTSAGKVSPNIKEAKPLPWNRGESRMRRLVVGVNLALAAALVQAAPASARMESGNYELRISDRYDFHTWIWALAWCGDDCRELHSVAQPIARAYDYSGRAHLLGDRWTYTADVPDGLRCGNVYYGQTIPTHDVYTWDTNTLAGTLTSTFDAGCDGQPGTLTYPIWLVRM
jgi:hypothetical protein